MADEFVAQAQDAAAAPGVTPGQVGGDTQTAGGVVPQSQTRDEQGRFSGQDGSAVPDQVTVSRQELEAIQQWGTRAEQLAREKQVAEERLALYEQALRASGQTHQNVYNSGHPNPSAYNFEQHYNPGQPAQAQDDPFGGIGDEEIMTGAELKKAVQGIASRLQTGQTQTQAQLQQALYLVQNPGAVQELREKLPGLVERAPVLADVIRNSPNPVATAHSLVSALGQQTQAPAGPDPADTLKRILANANQPGNAAGAGGGGMGISSASRIASMSDAEFAAYKEDVKAGRRKAGQ